MGILNRNDRSTSTSGEATGPQRDALQDKANVAKVLRDRIDELAPADLPKMSKPVREAVRDTIADYLADSEQDDDENDLNKRVEDGKVAVEASLERLQGTIMTNMNAISSFVPVTTISRHNKWIADEEMMMFTVPVDFVSKRRA